MNEPGKKAKLRQAQQRHQSQLFGDQAQKPSSQVADTHAQRRGQDLTEAAQAKQRRMSDGEARKLEDLKRRNARARAQQAPPAVPQPTVPEPQRVPEPDQPSGQQPDQATEPQRPQQPQSADGVHSLKKVAERSDLAAAALANMKQHVRQQNRRPAPPQETRQSTAPQDQPPAPRPASAQPHAPAQAPAPGTRRPPTPEELDRLLRQMADRSRQRGAATPGPASARPRPAMPGMPGRPEMGMESAAPVEAEPPPPDLVEKEKHTAEQSAEILKELQAKEATAREDIAPVPQSDQQRAKEEAVEARVPMRTSANSIDSGPLHEAVAQLQVAMRAQDPQGQVGGVNQVQRTMPHHPLYDPGAARQDRKRIPEDGS